MLQCCRRGEGKGKDMNHCKDCKYFEPNPHCPEDWGVCARARSDHGKAQDGRSLAVAKDFESFQADLQVSPDFGCVQFEQK